MFVWWYLSPLSTIFQLYRGDQFYWWKETGVPEENHRPVVNYWQTLSHNVVHLALIEIPLNVFLPVDIQNLYKRVNKDKNKQ